MTWILRKIDQKNWRVLKCGDGKGRRRSAEPIVYNVDGTSLGTNKVSDYDFSNATSLLLRWSRGSVLAFGTQVRGFKPYRSRRIFNPLNPELNPICYLLALFAHHFLHVSKIKVKSLTIRLLMSCVYIYIYMERLFLMFLDHTQRPTILAGERPQAAHLLKSWVRIPPGGMDICLLWVSCVVR